jgi:hypothetical protein
MHKSVHTLIEHRIPIEKHGYWISVFFEYMYNPKRRVLTDALNYHKRLTDVNFSNSFWFSTAKNINYDYVKIFHSLLYKGYNPMDN